MSSPWSALVDASRHPGRGGPRDELVGGRLVDELAVDGRAAARAVEQHDVVAVRPGLRQPGLERGFADGGGDVADHV